MDHLKLADRSWPVLTRLMGGHAAVYRATNGLIGHRFPGPSGRSRSSSSSRVSDAGRAGGVGGATPQGSASSERAVAERGTARWSGSEPIMRSPIVEVTPNQ
jgi:hypothetical protein